MKLYDITYYIFSSVLRGCIYNNIMLTAILYLNKSLSLAEVVYAHNIVELFTKVLLK